MRFLTSLRSLGSSLFRSKQMDAEMDEEMRLHIQNRADDLERSGISRVEAQRRARIEFGGVERFKEEIRETKWMTHLDSLFRDFRYAVRGLRKDKRFVFVAVFTLALGIGASTTVFSVFYNLLFHAFAGKNSDRLVVPLFTDAQEPDSAWPLSLKLADLDVVRQQNRVFENIVAYIEDSGLVLADDGTQRYQFFCTRVTSDAFDFYGVPALLGRGILPEDSKSGAPPVFVMSFTAWNGSFHADPDVLGKTITIDGEPRTLVGIMPPRFQAFGARTEIWTPLNQARDSGRPYASLPGELLARLKPGVTVQAGSADLDVIVKRLAADHPKDFPTRFTVSLQTARDHLLAPTGATSFFHSDLKHLLYDLLAAVIMLLLIACSNVANLLLTRATARGKEMAVRSALGAGRAQLVRQLLTESCVLAAGACLVGCALAWFGLRLVSAILPRAADVYGSSRIGAEAGLALNAPVLLFASGLTVLTTLICGLAPALRATRSDLQPLLASSGKGANSSLRHGKFRGALVVAQVTLSIVLIVGAGLMMRSFYLLTHVDLGFNPRNVLMTVFLPPPGRSKTPPIQQFVSPEGQAVLRGVTERLKALPGVAGVAIEDAMPGYSPTRGYQTSVPGSERSEEVGVWAGDENLLETLELRLIKGHWLSEREVRTAQSVGVVTQRLARDFFGDADPIGQQIKMRAFKDPFGGPHDVEFQIIGVISDVKTVGPQKPAIPIIFLPYTVRGGFFMLIKTTVDPASLKNAVQGQIWAVNRDEVVPLSSSLEDFLERFTYATPEFGLALALPLASISLLLVIVGVFSVMAYTVSLQTQEIGVRMALGAQQSEILRMVLRKGLALITAGIFIGLLASYGLTRFLASQIWGVSATDPWTFGAVVALVVITGIAACLLPARRAAGVDPLVALRYE
jgi:predicted permease